MALYLGIDTGTSGTKAVLVDDTGRLLASHTEEYALSTPRPQWAEQHPETDWWPAAVDAIAALLKTSGKTGDDIAAIGLTGQMHGSVFLDKNGAVLRPALLWCDSRTGAQCDEIETALGGQSGLFQTLGQPVVTSYTAPKILWVRDNEPEIYGKIAQILLPKDYIRYKLTGDYVAEVSDASGTALFDVRKRAWSKTALEKLRIPPEWLPRLVESPEVTGVVSPEAARLTGLRAGTIVVGGGGDQAANAVGTGVVARGRTASSLGTSGVVFAHADSPSIDPEMRIQTYAHAVPGGWGLMGCVLSAGGSLRWWRDTFQPGESYDGIVDAAARAPIGCEGLLFAPYLTGERTPYPDPNARGAFVGATLRTGREHFARAVLEGVAFAMKDSFALLSEAGVPVTQIRAAGGGAKSRVWLQMMADVIGVEHVVPTVDEGPAFGAALLAMVGSGAFSSVVEACDATLSTRPGATPNPETADAYAEAYARYRQLYPSLKSVFDSY